MASSKNDILRAGFLVVSVGGSALMWWLFRNINFVYVASLMFLMHQFVLVPAINRKYSKLMGAPVNNVRSYIPLINESDIFTPGLSKVTFILGVVLYVVAFFLILPYIGLDFLPVIIRAVFGDFLAMNTPFYLLITAVSLYIVINVFRGLGFATIAGVIDSEMKEYYRGFKTNNGALIIRLFVLFIPFIRTFSLAQLHDRLNNLVDVHKINTMKDKEFLEE